MMNLDILKEGAAERKALDKIQSEFLEVRQAIKATESALLPLKEARARLLYAFRGLVNEYRPEYAFEAFQAPNSTATTPREMSFTELLYLFGVDEVVDLVMKRFSAAGKPVGLPAAERATKLRELQARIEELERDEEIETLRLLDAGYIVLRREDVRREVLFQVWAERGA